MFAKSTFVRLLVLNFFITFSCVTFPQIGEGVIAQETHKCCLVKLKISGPKGSCSNQGNGCTFSNACDGVTVQPGSYQLHTDCVPRDFYHCSKKDTAQQIMAVPTGILSCPVQGDPDFGLAACECKVGLQGTNSVQITTCLAGTNQPCPENDPIPAGEQ